MRMKPNIYRDTMVRTLIVFALSLAICGLVSLLASCRTCKQIETHESVLSSDSIRERTVYIETLRIDTVTVTVEIPAQSAERLTRDSTSHLETDFALSDAWITGDGSLGHTLYNKPQTIEAAAPVMAKDRYLCHEKQKIRNIVVKRTQTVRVTVEKPLRWWHKTLMWAGGIAVVGVAAIAVGKSVRKIS